MTDAKEMIYLARRTFLLGHSEPPAVMFVSIAFHTALWASLSATSFGAPPPKSLSGAKYMGMTIHVVPTLTEDFYVA